MGYITKSILAIIVISIFFNTNSNSEIKKFNMVFVPASEKGDENDYTNLIKIDNVFSKTLEIIN